MRLSQRSRDRIADRLIEGKDLLDDEEANRFSVRAYRRSSEVLRAPPLEPPDILAREGADVTILFANTGTRLERVIDERSKTELRGRLEGKRVGRRCEAECRRFYSADMKASARV